MVSLIVVMANKLTLVLITVTRGAVILQIDAHTDFYRRCRVGGTKGNPLALPGGMKKL